MELISLFIVIVLIPLVVSTGVLIYNLFTAPIIQNKKILLHELPLISVLVPARNEELNIGECIESIASQSYPNLEIIIGNDESTDNTYRIAKEFSSKDHRISVLNIQPKDQNWTGKNWACNELAKSANGDFLLFIDADVRLNSNAISNAVGLLKKYKLNMLSCFPTQVVKSIGEFLIVPMMNWLLLSFLPLKQVYKSDRISFAAANGQFILFDKNDYRAVGGHSSIAGRVVEDMEFARLFKTNGKRIMTTLGGDAVSCRMYNGFSESVKGFAKNFYRGFNWSPASFVLLLFFFAIVFLLPALAILINLSFVWLVLPVVISRAIIALLSKQNIIINVLLHPIQIGLVFLLGFYSMYVSLNGKSVWKGRKIS
ncbi:MAG: glycosyltransferase family 2 protein [bacterium]